MKYILTTLLLLLGSSIFAQSLDKGIRLYQDKQIDEADEYFSSIKSTSSVYDQAQFYLGRIAFDRKEYDDARDYFENAIEANSDSSRYYTWLGNSIGIITRTAGKFRQARLAPKIKRAYEQAVKLNPAEIDAQWGLVSFYTEAPGFMGGSWSKAEATAKAIGKIDPLQGHDALIKVYMGKEEYKLAEKEHLAAVKLDPARMANLGVFYQNRESYDKAFDIFEKAFIQFPENMSLLYQIGRTSALSGKRAVLGIKSLQRYLVETDVDKAVPSHGGAKMRLAMIYEKQGDVKKAKILYEESLRLEPDMELAKKGLKRVR